MVASEKSTYYRRPGIVHLVWVPLGLALVAVSHLMPELAPNDYLGPLGWVNQLLIEKHPMVIAGIFYFAVIAHVGEGAFAFYLARKKNIEDQTALLWGIQTLVYGIFSLKHLLKYKPGQKSQ